MLSPALSGRSKVISYHLRDVGIFIYGTVGYNCYHGKELCVNKMRPGGMTIMKQQGMEVLVWIYLRLSHLRTDSLYVLESC
jgi:hypothetical protein